MDVSTVIDGLRCVRDGQKTVCGDCYWFSLAPGEVGRGYCRISELAKEALNIIVEQTDWRASLLPCKRCGADRGYVLNYHQGGHRVACPNCGYCTKEKETVKEACYAWNQRTVKQSTIMKPAEFAEKMKSLDVGNAVDEIHLNGDVLMGDLLTSLGYGEGVEEFYALPRWYE